MELWCTNGGDWRIGRARKEQKAQGMKQSASLERQGLNQHTKAASVHLITSSRSRTSSRTHPSRTLLQHLVQLLLKKSLLATFLNLL